MADDPVRLIRRLAPSDIDSFREIQRHGVFYAHARDIHTKWVAKAARELLGGERIGYGFFHPSSTHGSLLGCILMRRTSANIIELKNLVVHPVCDGTGGLPTQTAVAEALIARAEQTCKHRGFSQIEIELLSTDRTQIELFLTAGYALESLHGSFPNVEVNYYLLWKELLPEYHGDPFDCLSMARWLLSERLGWTPAMNPEPISFGDSRAQLAFRLRFEVYPSREFGARSKRDRFRGAEKRLATSREHEAITGTGTAPIEDTFKIWGECVVDLGEGTCEEFKELLRSESPLSADESADSNMPCLSLVISTRQLIGLENEARASGFRPVLGGDLLFLTGYLTNREAVALSKDAVKGVLLYIGSAYTVVLKRFSADGTPFSYVLINGIGTVIYERISRDDASELWAVFCTESQSTRDSTDQARQIVTVGRAKILDAVPRGSDLIDEELRGRKTLWEDVSTQEFVASQFSVNFHENDLAYILHLEAPEILENEVSLRDLADSTIQPFLSEITRFGFSALYAGDMVDTVVAMQRRCLDSSSASDGSPASPGYPIDLRLVIGLQHALHAIEASKWLKTVIKQSGKEISRKLIDQERDVLSKTRSRLITNFREGGNRQPTLFEAVIDKTSAARLSETLDKVEKSFNTFQRGYQEAYEGFGPGQVSSYAKTVCLNVRECLTLARDLGMQNAEAVKVQEWLDAIVDHKRRFRVGLTFSSHQRGFVRAIANLLAETMGKDYVLFDEFHQSLFAGMGANETLPQSYVNDCELVVAFFSAEYGTGWSGFEWGQLLRYMIGNESYRVLPIQVEEFNARHLGFDKQRRDICWDIRKADGELMDGVEVREGILKRLKELAI